MNIFLSKYGDLIKYFMYFLFDSIPHAFTVLPECYRETNVAYLSYYRHYSIYNIFRKNTAYGGSNLYFMVIELFPLL